MQEAENKIETNKRKKIKTRTVIVMTTLAIFVIGILITYRANYLEVLEIGENYVETFMQNIKYKILIGTINFILIFAVTYITNILIKKGLKNFFEEEKIEMPKLPNKSLALVIALIVAIITPRMFLEKIILFINNSQFGINDPIFGMDIGFYMFQAPLINLILYYLLAIVIGLSIYTAIYCIVIFNVYFDGINGQTLKNSKFIKDILLNVMIITILIVAIMIFNLQNIVMDKFLILNDELDTSIIGAGMVASTIQLWGYRVLGVIIIISVYMAIQFFKKGNSKNVIKSLAIVPTYLVFLFVAIVGYKIIFINGNELDREKTYITTNIDYTKTAYNIKIEEKEIESTGTITVEEAEKNKDIIENSPIVTEKVALNNLLQTQTSTGYYTYSNPKALLYKNKLTYIAAREIDSTNTTYNSKADEYTHGYGTIQISASETDENGNVIYLSKDFENKEIKEPKIYYGMETNSIITTSEKKEEFDYPKTTSQNISSSYSGEGGISLGFLDRLALGIKEKKLGIVFAGSTEKILPNRNVIQRAKKIMPYLLYDEEPYLTISNDGKLYWVLDAYTISNKYPYSQKTRITTENNVQEINYIRNSVKVIVNAYDGEINFYITDKTDPIIMVYNNMYNTLFKEESEIPKDISEYFTYSEFLYKIQAEMLNLYHDVSADVLYRGNDVWQIASYSNQMTTTAKAQMEPLLTMIKTEDSNKGKLGLVLAYNQYKKESLNAYLVGTVEEGKNNLTLYKFSNDSSVVGPMQLDNLIEQDETISKEIESLNVTGTKITKEMIIVPIDNTMLNIIPIYQTSLNETNSVPILKKVVVASGNKIAIGDNFSEALKNLLSPNYAVDIEVQDTSTIEGIIQSIIKANKNLDESNEANDWEQIGRDIKELQTLVKQLENMMKNDKQENDKQENEIYGEANIVQDVNDINNIYSSNDIE